MLFWSAIFLTSLPSIRISQVFMSAFPSGDFFFVNRSQTRPGAAFRTKIITSSGGVRRTELMWRSDSHALIAREMDPAGHLRSSSAAMVCQGPGRKSHRLDRSLHLLHFPESGDHYCRTIYSTEGELQAIVGVDIEIHQLSTFISKLRIGKNGRAFMLNNNGDVVAFPDQSKIRVTDAAQGEDPAW
jgi:two-component system cell cycle sensor histidine kinase/response regulator CckA